MMKHFLPYLILAIRARKDYKAWGVSVEFLEIWYRIQWHNKVDHWSQERLNMEMLALAFKYPEDADKIRGLK